MITAVDLFCGVGGLTKGLASAGVDVRMGVDIDGTCEFPYTANNDAKFLLRSVEELIGKDLDFGKTRSYKLLAGCAPCQPFSGYRKGIDGASDKRWHLLAQFDRLVKECKPDLVTMENVPRLSQQSVFKKFVKSLKKQGYFVSFSIVKCADYGMPQDRARLVLLASKLGQINLVLPSPKIPVRTVRDAIGDLPKIEAGKSHKSDRLHTAAALTEINKKRIKASKPGGTWKDWDRSLMADCHSKKSGSTYRSVYGRMSWDLPSPTITTQFFGYGNGRFGHPVQNRAISVREGAILQGFPQDYKFLPDDDQVNLVRLGRLIGNAVPVGLGELIGRSFVKHIKFYNK